MRLDAIALRDTPPVRLFEVRDLSDLIVIAGANGVGKTRLMQALLDRLRSPNPGAGLGGRIIATCDEERAQWGQTSLDLGLQQDMLKMTQTLSSGQRRRRNWKSSLLNFESDRSIQNLQPFPFSFDMTDPSEEGVGWDVTFAPLKNRYQDTLHAMHRMVEMQRRGIAVTAQRLKREGKTSMNLDFSEPMAPFKDVFRQLVGPKELADLNMADQRLKYVENGETRDFDALSSGEREVVNIAFDFLLRNPRDCIVVFDEPELHLHPELSYKLVQTLQTIGERNQFVFVTHSPDIISASLDRSVIFLAPPIASEPPQNQAVVVSEDDDSHEALKLLGQSIGIVALGRKIVLIEGGGSSLDKQAYGSILKRRNPDLVLVPSGGKHAIESFAHVHDAVLSKSIWGVEFFMLCDGDSRPAGATSSDRLAVLPRYHLENYFLDETVWAQVFEELEPEGSWLRDSTQIGTRLIALAREQVSLAVALRVAAEIRQEAGNVTAMPKEINGLTEEELVAKVRGTLEREKARLQGVLDPDAADGRVRVEYQRIVASLDANTNDWRELVPGKPLLARFAGAAGLKPGHAKSLYIQAVERHSPTASDDIHAIFDSFSAT
jgi:ABC-type cobalamin/Fe3+-siderophores transport system ATPase subunit